jgi:pimeloyl-ACP methyl ester carboxylesterase
MALLPVDDDALPDDGTLASALAGIEPALPVVIMIHGFRFSPSVPVHDPHAHILSLAPGRSCWKAVSWPRHLGLSGKAGLALGFGWQARGTIWQAHARAAQAGARLARLIAALRRVAPERPVHIFAHSLGARVALTALPRLPAGAVDRVILIAAAAFCAESRRAMSSPAGRSVEVINVLGRENWLFDLLLRSALPLRGPTLGRGLRGLGNWLDLPLDKTHTLLRLADMGFRIRPARVYVCHWSSYLRPGVFSLYKALLLRPSEMPLALLRQQVLPPVQADLGARLFALVANLPILPRRRTPL